jgi:hypothetical protein
MIFIRSLALRIMYGSLVFLVVETVMEPSTYAQIKRESPQYLRTLQKSKQE